MDEHKTQGQQHQGQPKQGQGQQGQHAQPGNQGGQQNWKEPQHPNRDQAEGSREQHLPGAERTKGTGHDPTKNRSSESDRQSER